MSQLSKQAQEDFERGFQEKLAQFVSPMQAQRNTAMQERSNRIGAYNQNVLSRSNIPQSQYYRGRSLTAGPRPPQLSRYAQHRQQLMANTNQYSAANTGANLTRRRAQPAPRGRQPGPWARPTTARIPGSIAAPPQVSPRQPIPPQVVPPPPQGPTLAQGSAPVVPSSIAAPAAAPQPTPTPVVAQPAPTPAPRTAASPPPDSLDQNRWKLHQLGKMSPEAFNRELARQSAPAPAPRTAAPAPRPAPTSAPQIAAPAPQPTAPSPSLASQRARIQAATARLAGMREAKPQMLAKQGQVLAALTKLAQLTPMTPSMPTAQPGGQQNAPQQPQQKPAQQPAQQQQAQTPAPTPPPPPTLPPRPMGERAKRRAAGHNLLAVIRHRGAQKTAALSKEAARGDMLKELLEELLSKGVKSVRAGGRVGDEVAYVPSTLDDFKLYGKLIRHPTGKVSELSPQDAKLRGIATSFITKSFKDGKPTLQPMKNLRDQLRTLDDTAHRPAQLLVSPKNPEVTISGKRLTSKRA